MSTPSSEVSPVATPGVVHSPETLRLPWGPRVSRSQLLKLLSGMLLIGGLLVWMLLGAHQSDWKVLFANLSDKDGGAIVAQLSQMNVPYKHSEAGGAILVPADRVHETRLKLASAGLPKGSIGGFDVVEANRFGMTQFQEKLTFQRGLEGELSRSIQSLASVQSARVHLAIPHQNGFFREQQKPSASVLVNLHPGRTLDRVQIAGIVHLVASSVPELHPKAVSVIDGGGGLLSTPVDAPLNGADAQQLQYVQQLEQMYMRRVLEILEPVVGRSNVRAQVTAEVDFSQTEMTSEQHKPNQGGEAATIRSQQLVENGTGGGAMPAGIPGAASNQPMGAASAPVNAAAASPSIGMAGSSQGGKRESVTNYEVDKTTRVVRGATGVIRRITTAVVLNDAAPSGSAARTTTQTLSAEQLARITAVVREAVGFNKDRGDSVQVMSTPFTAERTEVMPVPWWKDGDMLDIAKAVVWPLAMFGVAAMLVLTLVLPAVKDMRVARQVVQAPSLDAVVSDAPDRAALAAPESHVPLIALNQPQTRMQELQDLARQNPALVAGIVKGWMNGQATH